MHDAEKSLKGNEQGLFKTERETYLRSILDITQDAFMVITEGGVITDVNEAFYKMTGYAEEDMTSISLTDLVIHEDPNITRERIKQVSNQGSVLFETKHRKKDGSLVDVEISVACLRREPLTTVCFLRDITNRKIAEASLMHSHNLMRYIIEHNRIAVGIFDKNLNYMYVSKPYMEIYGVNDKDIIGKHMYDIFPSMPRQVREIHKRVLTGEVLVQEEDHYVTKNGTLNWVSWECRPWYESDGSIGGMVFYAENITERKHKQTEIEYLSYYDHLTGLYNRRFIEETLKRLDADENLPLSIIIADVNGLKLANDAFGHEAGDRLIKAVAEILKKVCRPDDFAGRTGGDEFCIILPHTGQMQAAEIKQRILAETLILNLEPLIVSLAVGYATKISGEQDIKAIMTAADNHMYKVKLKHGRIMRSQMIDMVLHNINVNYDHERVHTERVSHYCLRIASAMNLSERETNDLKAAGELHDIGKIMVPPQLLNKSEKLTKEEFEVIRRHPEIGYQIIKSVDEYVHLADFVLHHHERWDGSGYPEGLSGNAIPLISRIIAVADAYEAMTAARPYQKTKTKGEAVKELKKCAGTQFDSGIVEIFINKVL